MFNREKRLDLVEEFKVLLSFSQEELYYFLQYILPNYYSHKDIFYGPNEEEDFIVCKGSRIALVAHLDTVHFTQPTNETIIFDKEKEVFWSPVGIGGDDRNGVFAILQILEYCQNNEIEMPTVLFMKDEESGCLGAMSFLINFDYSKIDIGCMIELDRQGSTDSVYYDCLNKTFIDYINSFGFVESVGSYTDVSIISEGFPVPYVNLSIGYYNQHTKAEFIMFEKLFNTVEKVINILEDDFLYSYNEKLEELPKIKYSPKEIYDYESYEAMKKFTF